jgi:hypothetical protein
MKKLIVLLIAVIPFISNCKKETSSDLNMQIREIAWNSLTTQQKSTVNVDWKQAPVAQTTYNGKSAWSVRFNTTDDAVLGPIIMIVDSTTKVVLGQALRD